MTDHSNTIEVDIFCTGENCSFAYMDCLTFHKRPLPVSYNAWAYAVIAWAFVEYMLADSESFNIYHIDDRTVKALRSFGVDVLYRSTPHLRPTDVERAISYADSFGNVGAVFMNWRDGWGENSLYPHVVCSLDAIRNCVGRESGCSPYLTNKLR